MKKKMTTTTTTWLEIFQVWNVSDASSVTMARDAKMKEMFQVA